VAVNKDFKSHQNLSTLYEGRPNHYPDYNNDELPTTVPSQKNLNPIVVAIPTADVPGAHKASSPLPENGETETDRARFKG